MLRKWNQCPSRAQQSWGANCRNETCVLSSACAFSFAASAAPVAVAGGLESREWNAGIGMESFTCRQHSQRNNQLSVLSRHLQWEIFAAKTDISAKVGGKTLTEIARIWFLLMALEGFYYSWIKNSTSCCNKLVLAVEARWCCQHEEGTQSPLLGLSPWMAPQSGCAQGRAELGAAQGSQGKLCQNQQPCEHRAAAIRALPASHSNPVSPLPCIVACLEEMSRIIKFGYC